MKHIRACAILAILTAIIITTNGCIEGFPTNPFPSPTYGTNPRVGQGFVITKMSQGWFDGKQVWYVCWGSNVLKFRGDSTIFDDDTVQFTGILNPNPIPKLTSALGTAARPIYFVTNFQQGPVFSTVPDNDDYSALWQVFYVTWLPGSAPRPVSSVADLPSAGEAIITPTDIVVDYSVMAVGPLGGKWYPAPAGAYRIPQALDVDVRLKQITLPTWATFGVDPITKTVLQTEVAIPDACDPELAAVLGANHAPGLLDMPLSDTQKIWIFDWTQVPGPPPGQLPVMENVLKNAILTNGRTGPNINYDYSPIMQVLLTRSVNISPRVFNNPQLIQQSIKYGYLEVVDDSTCLNVMLINYRKWTNGSGDRSSVP